MKIPLLYLKSEQTLFSIKTLASLSVLLYSVIFSFEGFAQNAIPGCTDKTSIMVGIVPVSGDAALTRSEVYAFGGSSNPNTGTQTCTVQKGGAEGLVTDHDRNITYMATCCGQSEILRYDYVTGTFLTPIKLPGEDLLDMTISSDNQFLYVTSYNGISKVSTISNSVVDYYQSSSFNNKTGGLWGIAIHPTTGNVYAGKNWNLSGQTSTIEYVSSSLTGASTLLATAPAGFNVRGINFSSDGDLWALLASNDSNIPDRLVRYNSTTGAVKETFNFSTNNSGPATGGAVDSFDLAFGPDGNLYITTYKGDCITKFDVTTKQFSTYVQYHAGVQGKSITFLCGNFKCNDCAAPAVTAANVATTTATCTNGIVNNNATATLSGLVFNATKAIEGAIKEGATFGTTPIFGAGANLTLNTGETSFTFTGLKPGTTYTIRVWAGSDACYNDVTFTTAALSAKVTSSAGATLCGAGIATLTAACTVGVPQWYSSASSTTTVGTGNSFITNVNSNTSFFVGCKLDNNACIVPTENRTEVKVNVSTPPAAPTQANVSGGVVCNTAASIDLTATCSTGTTPVWYDSQSSTTLLHTGSPFNVFVNATKTYFVGCKDLTSGCESALGTRATAVANFSTIATPSISTSTSPVCAGTNVVVSAPSSSTYAWTGPNGFTANTQNLTFNNIQTNQAGIYTLTVSNGICSATSTLNLLIFDSPQGITATATNSTCNVNTPKNDGSIKLSGFGVNLRFDVSTGATYTGTKTYTTATNIPSDGLLRSDISNPTTVFQQYTVRVFNANDCFADYTVTIQQVTCDCGEARCIPYTVQKTKTVTKKSLITISN
ncbi:Ig-like domain-containing protein [Arcicella rigui]|uniref:Ig-like domain-containing protein n=1 Tax=Arcicella rigui TaxID=797020 RepID=A0ABU5QAS2_9BACT|nr:hypothetical protein [Arcicella rigui]MEA5139727.1 hypothetical protein [Arcicella rigui]